MNTDQIQALYVKVNDDPALQARFKAVSDEAGFNALISELGFEVSFADFAGAADAELSDGELADVAGGVFDDIGGWIGGISWPSLPSIPSPGGW